MNSKSNQRQTSPALVLYKKALDGRTAQAAWYDQSVEASAKVFGDRQGFTVASIGPSHTDAVRAALAEGPVADKGTLALHLVKPEVLDRLLALLAADPANAEIASSKAPAATTPPTATSSPAPSNSPTIDLWAALTVNMVALAPELTDGVPEGW